MVSAGTDLGQQLPPVGIVDLYGLRKVSQRQVLLAVNVKPGDDALHVLQTRDEILRRIRSIKGVDGAAIEVVCCSDADKKSIVFVGIRERGTSDLVFREAPKGDVRLPAEFVKAGEDFQRAFQNALGARDFTEDSSQGYSLMGFKQVRDVQQRFITLASPNYQILRRVLRESGEPWHRALAAMMIAYAADRQSVIDDLAFAMDDPDDTTRNNATRALILLAKYAQAHPDAKLRIPPLPFVRMLNSLSWTDRNKSAGALDTLTLARDPSLIAELRRQALDSLAEMARWQNPGHALPSFNILARVAGLSEDEIAKAWSSPDREKQVQSLVQRIRRPAPARSAETNMLQISPKTIATAENVF